MTAADLTADRRCRCEQGRRRVLTTLVLYLMHLLLAAVTLFLSTQLVEHSRAFHEHGDGSSDWL